ncbi:hypothetical protein KUTeg_010336, partial [Tegillarca granosa]
MSSKEPSYTSLLQLINLDVESKRWHIIFIVFFISVIYLWKKTHRNFPNGPLVWPLIGNLDFFRSKSHIRLTNLKDKYGDVYSIKIGKHDAVIVCSFEGVMELARAEQLYEVIYGRPDFMSHHVLYRGDRQRGMNTFVKSISTADMDEKMIVKRKFLVESIDSYCSTETGIEDKISLEALSLTCFFMQQTDPFDPAECFQFAHLHIMMSLVFNQKYNPEDETLDEIFESFEERSEAKRRQFYDYCPFLNSFYREQFQRISHRTTLQLKHQKIILNHHKDMYNPTNLKDMTDHLLHFIENNEDHCLINNDDMDYLLLDLAGSGFAAVPSLLTWLLGYMALFPQVQAKVQEELDSVVGRERFPSLHDQPFVPYTMAVILEVHRIVTVFPFLLPYRTIKNCYDLPKDTLMFFNIWSIHHDKRYWKNPMRFDPERFLDETRSLVIPDYFIPFGVGERRCPGESLVEVEVFIFFT